MPAEHRLRVSGGVLLVFSQPLEHTDRIHGSLAGHEWNLAANEWQAGGKVSGYQLLLLANSCNYVLFGILASVCRKFSVRDVSCRSG